MKIDKNISLFTFILCVVIDFYVCFEYYFFKEVLILFCFFIFFFDYKLISKDFIFEIFVIYNKKINKKR